MSMEKTADSLFTGERFMPGIEDEKLAAEHLERYMALKSLVSGKRVADIACGEGYGSRIMADWALEVSGVDIDAETIENAREKYGDAPNLKYYCGSAAHLDMFADHTVDVLISFETIEHITEEMQLAFLAEAARILKEDGLLVMSTPNKAIYSDLYHYKNEFHIKEFYRQEFLDFLGTKFQYVKIYRQYQEVATCIEGEEKEENYTRFYIKENGARDEKYVIALAANREITEGMSNAIVISEKMVYENLNQRIVQLQEEEEERNVHIARLDEELEEKGAYIQKLQKMNQRVVQLQEEEEERNAHIARLDEELEEKGTYIRKLQKTENEKNEEIQKIQSICNDLRLANESLQTAYESLRISNERLQTVNESLRTTNEGLQTINASLHTANEGLQAVNEDLRIEKDGLQTVNESLRTTNEGLQTVNEGLRTTNEGLQAANEGLQIEKEGLQAANEGLQIEKEGLQAANEDLQIEKEGLQAANDDLLAEKENLQTANGELQTVNESLRIEKEGLQTENENLRTASEGLQAANDSLQSENAALQSNVAELQQEVLNKKGHIELLLPPERELIAIKKSKMFKIMRFFCRGLDILLIIPKFVARQLAAFFRMMGHVNVAELKIAWGYVRNEGIPGAYRHLMRDYHQGMEKKIPIEVRKEVYIPITDLSVCGHLTLPKTDCPEVSIVIPAYNQFTYTYFCLKSIIENSGDVAYEVILADDCSTDETTNISSVVDNLVIARTAVNQLFLRNCNHAAKYARGKYILFLNNDTQVQKNWLQPLVDLMERDEKIGLTGSKLVYSDGTLQEAGGIIWKDASGWNYGRNDNALKPEYNYVKETDYISGASIMIRKSLWEELGGFDELFAPAYYEDSDLAFQVRAAGYKVVYQPLSVVVHFEGKSNGTDLNSGVKKYQVENNEKFWNKWREVLERDHLPNAQDVYLAKDRSQLKKRILVVDHYVPHYDKDAGGRCTYMYLKLFLKFGFKVTFIGDNFYPHEPYTTELKQMGIEVLYGDYYYLNWQDWLKENLHYFDYIYLQRPHIAIKYIDLVKQYGRGKIFYFAHDLHFIRLTREYKLKGDPEILAQAEKFKKDEFYLFNQADVVHVVGSYEQGVLQKELPGKPVRNIPLYIYEKLPEDINKDFASRHDIVYVGGFGHPPNVDAVTWFAREVYPDILKAYPDMVWHIVGANAPDEIKELASKNIVLEGFLSDEDLEKMYRSCRLAVVPLRVGAGVKGKVVEAAYYQIPLVTTSIGEEGISSEEGAFIAEDDAEKMAQLIISLYEDYDRLKKMSDSGAALIRNHYMLDEAERVLKLDL